MRISGNSGCESCRGGGHREWGAAREAAATRRGGNDGPGGVAAGATRGRVAVETSQSSRAELSLTTADGDKVVLSVSSGAAEVFSANRSSGDYRYLQSQRAQVAVQVEGNLSEAELQDIRKLAQIIGKASSDVMRGDAAKAAEGVERATQLGSIQNFAFSLNKQVDYRYSLEG